MQHILIKNQESNAISNRFTFAVVFITSIIMMSCSAPEQTYGDFGLANYSGRTIAVETNLISAADITADSIQFVPDFDYCNLCSTPLTDEPIHQLSLEELAENMTDGFVNIYIIGSDNNLQLVKTWRYSERNEQGRQLFNEQQLRCSYGRAWDNTYHTYYEFALLPEDINLKSATILKKAIRG